jgi:hypothetical protein
MTKVLVPGANLAVNARITVEAAKVTVTRESPWAQTNATEVAVRVLRVGLAVIVWRRRNLAECLWGRNLSAGTKGGVESQRHESLGDDELVLGNVGRHDQGPQFNFLILKDRQRGQRGGVDKER